MALELQKGRPADTTGRLDKEIRTYDLLDRLGVEYDRVDHAPAMTMEDCKEVDEILESTRRNPHQRFYDYDDNTRSADRSSLHDSLSHRTDSQFGYGLHYGFCHTDTGQIVPWF